MVQKLLKIFRKKSRKTFIVPANGADESIWKAFLEKADWQTIFDVYQKFEVRNLEHRKHDENIRWLIWDRLFTFEFPVFSSEFMVKNRHHTLVVENNASAEVVRNFVADHHSALMGPMYIVEQSGKFRGFAIDDDLIVVGVTSVVGSPDEVKMRVQELGFSLLTKTDSQFVKHFLPRIIRLMERANLPSLREVYTWQVETKSHRRYFAAQRTFADLDKSRDIEGYSVLLAKL